jgi:hypothetical protein
MIATEKSTRLLQSVPDDADTAMSAGRRERMNGALETIEGVRPAVHRDLKRLVIVIAAGFTGSHDIHLHLWRGSNRSTFALSEFNNGAPMGWFLILPRNIGAPRSTRAVGRRGSLPAFQAFDRQSRKSGEVSDAMANPASGRGLIEELILRNSTAFSEVWPRPTVAKSQVRQIQAYLAMARCRFASAPLDCA